LIIPSATPDDPPLQARSTGEAGHKAFKKSGPYPRLPDVADDMIEAPFLWRKIHTLFTVYSLINHVKSRKLLIVIDIHFYIWYGKKGSSAKLTL
jgi:hypothetical protein